MRRALAVLAVLVLLAGCSNEPDLDGKSFTSTEVTGHDLAEDTTIDLTFEDGRLTVVAGCNTQSADYEVDGDTLRWSGDAMSTLIGCPDELQEQDQWLNELFTDGVDASLDDSTLTLTSDDVEIVLEAD